MSEIKKFTGQLVLSQILDVILSPVINAANRKHRAKRYYKRLPLNWKQRAKWGFEGQLVTAGHETAN